MINLLIIFLLANSIKVTSFYYLIQAGTAGLVTQFFLSLMISTVIFGSLVRYNRPFIFVTTYLIQTLYICLNIYYYCYYRNIIPFSAYTSLYSEAMGLVGNLALPGNSTLFLSIIDLPCAVACLYYYKKIHVEITLRFPNINRMFCAVFGMIIVTYCLIYMLGRHSAEAAISIPAANKYSEVEKLGLAAVNIAELANRNNIRVPTVNYGKETSIQANQAALNNVIVIQVESLDSRIVNTRHKGELVMPFLNDLTQKSIYYPYLLCYLRSGGTSDSEVAALNSIEPNNVEPIMKSATYTFPNSVVKTLNRKYTGIQAFHGNSGSFYFRKNAYSRMGFQKFHDIEDMNLQEVGWGAPDHQVFSYIKKQLATQKSPFFYYIITMSSHEMFKNVNLYFSNPDYDDIDNKVSKRYLNSMNYVDSALAEFVSYVQNYYPNTYIFIYGDHPPYVIKDDFYRPSIISAKGGDLLFVPLFIISPDRKVHFERTSVAGYLDLGLTMLAATGISGTLKSDGHNLLIPPDPSSLIKFRGTAVKRDKLFSIADKQNK